jgi:hypothetical protein
MKPNKPPAKHAAASAKFKTDQEKIDDSIEASFPASDPPATSPMTTGAPKRSRPAHGPKKHALKKHALKKHAEAARQRRA